MSDENKEEMSLDEDVKMAVEEARAHLAPQYAPFGMEPEIHVVEVCGLVMVCTPWPIQKRNLACRGVTAQASAADISRVNEQRIRDTIFWARGQLKDGPAGARDHVAALAKLGGKFMAIYDKAADACGELEDNGAGGKAQAKKL